MQNQQFSSCNPQFYHLGHSNANEIYAKNENNSLTNNGGRKMSNKKRKTTNGRKKEKDGRSKGVGIKFGGKKPHQVARRNERERKRVQQVNNGYEMLASTLTKWEAICGDKKLTKAETLKAAILYIRHLEDVLHSSTPGQTMAPMAKRPKQNENSMNDDYDWSQMLMNSSPPEETIKKSPSTIQSSSAEISPNFGQNATDNFYGQQSTNFHHSPNSNDHLFLQTFPFDYI